LRNGQAKLARPLGELKIAPTVQATLSARIDRLPPAERELLQTLAVVGKELALELIKGVTGKSEEQLEALLSNLQLSEFIYEQPTVGGAEYVFKHALTQEVSYNSLLAERRRMIHEQTARSTERLYAEQLEDHWSELTHHYLHGIDAAKAVHYARLAAEQAASRSAYPEAASIIEAALGVLDKIPDSAERIRAELALRGVEWLLTLVRFAPSSPERERIALRMCELGEKIGESDELLRGLQVLAALYFNRGEPLRGLTPGKRCLRVAEATQDPRLLAGVHHTVGVLSLSCGNLREAVSHFEEAGRHIEQTNPEFLMGAFLGRSANLSTLARAMQLLGRVGEANELSEEALRRARESGHLFSLAIALVFGGQILRCYRREPEIVRGRADEATSLCEESGFPVWLPYVRVLHGWALAELGQLAQGVAEIEDGVAGLRRLGTPMWQQYPNALLAQGYARMGRTDEAHTMLNQALARIEQTGEMIEHSEILRLKGEVLLMRDGLGTKEAEHCFRAALEVAHRQEARWWELRTSVSFARLLCDTNRSDEARTMLADIYTWFTEGFDLPDLNDAKALIDELNA
jgi:tetratricopeptide (TPR) repeat protein